MPRPQQRSGQSRNRNAPPPPAGGGREARSRLPRKSGGFGGGGKGRGSATRSPLGWIGYGLGVAAVWIVFAGILLTFWFARDLPPISSMPPPAGQRAVEVRAADDTLIARYGENYGEWLRHEDIPQVLIHALVATEDQHFFSHFGFDPTGLARAVWVNYQSGRRVQGGSTITQQLAKNMTDSDARTLKRKAQEVLLAMELEQKFSKEEILELYLNQVYFGAGTYGVDSASRIYFGHSARHLTIQEAAILVGLLKAPTSYAPTRNLEKSWDRAQIVLDRMAAEGFITIDRAEAVKANPPSLRVKATGGDGRWFADWVRDRAMRLVPPGRTPIIVKTTLDMRLQDAMDHAIKAQLNGDGKAKKVTQGAGILLSLDGAIRAMIGGSSYADTQFNRVIQAKRQPGSSFKPFIYLAALESGYTPDQVFEDKPFEVEGWEPRNYTRDNQGPMTLRDALRKSINTIAVTLSENVGRDRVARMANRLGIRDDIPRLPSLALGTMETSLYDLTRAYGAIATGGYLVEPYAISNISTPNGTVLFTAPPQRFDRVLGREVVSTMAEMMTGVMEPGGTGTAAKLDRPAAGKTGTTQDSRDALFVGFTADFVGGVWFGNDDNSPMDHVTGGSIPARAWAETMRAAEFGLAARPLQPALNENEGDADTGVSDEDQQKLDDRLKDLFGQ